MNKLEKKLLAAEASRLLAGPRHEGRMQALSVYSSRTELCAALQALDPNGCHTDAAHAAEGLAPLTDAEAWTQLENILSAN